MDVDLSAQSQTYAAWSQAITSLLAIVVAVGVPLYINIKDRKERQKRDRQLEWKEAEHGRRGQATNDRRVRNLVFKLLPAMEAWRSKATSSESDPTWEDAGSAAKRMSDPQHVADIAVPREILDALDRLHELGPIGDSLNEAFRCFILIVREQPGIADYFNDQRNMDAQTEDDFTRFIGYNASFAEAIESATVQMRRLVGVQIVEHDGTIGSPESLDGVAQPLPEP